jgi:hypothetical protein
VQSHPAKREVDKRLTKRIFERDPRKEQNCEYSLIHWRFEWWAWVDLNHRPRPYQGSVVRFYNNLQDRGDCQTTRKSHKTSHFVGWVVGWKKSTNSETTPHSFPRASFWIVSELPTIRPESGLLAPAPPFLGSDCSSESELGSGQ